MHRVCAECVQWQRKGRHKEKRYSGLCPHPPPLHGLGSHSTFKTMGRGLQYEILYETGGGGGLSFLCQLAARGRGTNARVTYYCYYYCGSHPLSSPPSCSSRMGVSVYNGIMYIDNLFKANFTVFGSPILLVTPRMWEESEKKRYCTYDGKLLLFSVHTLHSKTINSHMVQE